MNRLTPEERMKDALMKSLIRSGTECIMFFHLPGCHYCDLMKPVIRTSTKAKMFIDANEYPGLVDAYGIHSFPVTRVFSHGTMQREIMGYQKL
jgi:hypothetical protein